MLSCTDTVSVRARKGERPLGDSGAGRAAQAANGRSSEPATFAREGVWDRHPSAAAGFGQDSDPLSAPAGRPAAGFALPARFLSRPASAASAAGGEGGGRAVQAARKISSAGSAASGR